MKTVTFTKMMSKSQKPNRKVFHHHLRRIETTIKFSPLKDHWRKVKAEQRVEEFEEQTSSNSQIYGAFEYNEVLPKRFASAGEKFNKDHVIEIMFRSKIFSEELEIDIIKELYEGL